jgi:hypothetical protein
MKNDFYVDGDITIIYVKCKGQILECLIDTKMLNKANEFPYTWFARHIKASDTYYISGGLKIGKYKQQNVMFHRWLTDAPESKLVDHRNHNPLDNRLENLRLVNYSENGHNRKGKADTRNSSGVRNVTWDRVRSMWRAAVTLHGTYNDLGYYGDLEDASKAVETFRKENGIWLN